MTNYKIGMYKKEYYFMPDSNDIPAGIYTTTITKLKLKGVLVDIVYENHPEFNKKNEFESYHLVSEYTWSSPINVQLPEDLFTL